MSCMSYLCILQINPLSVAWFADIFSHSVGCIFILFMVSFAVQKLLSLIRCHLFIFIFITVEAGSQEGDMELFFQFSCSVVSDSLRPHELQHARPLCPSPTPGVHSNSRPSSRLCHPAISSDVVPFSSCPQSLSASESFPMSQLFTWGGQSTGVSALASVLQKNTQDWSPLEWTG